MIYIITFLEGLISFISPCMLPMIPIYLTYFAGDANKENNSTITNAISFVIGFTIVFCILGIFAGTIGGLLKDYQNIVNIVCGIIVIIFGLNYLEFINIKIFKSRNKKTREITGVFSAFLFGVIFSINLTPCVGAFLGSALMMASVSGTILKGIALLFVYSLGLGIPIVISAILIKKLNSVFDFIKKNYSIINNICGIFLIIIGISMSFGLMNKLLYSFI
ncbi:MAG: cytochrome c biogenesis protein CcdA [Clostridia bacterium]|nr:cytochrome c biogenesis protein CcdA [Clostridia bacterium]